MHSSFSVIKCEEVLKKESRKISTSYQKEDFIKNKEDNISEESVICEDEKKEILKSYKTIGENIIKDAKSKKEYILNNAYEEAREIEKESYQKGYEEGLSNGYEDGYKDSYEKNIIKAQNEYEQIIDNASKTLRSANLYYEDYLKSKKDEILNLSLEIAQKILMKKLKDEDVITDLLDNALKNAKGSKTVIIRCNSIHEEEILKFLPEWTTKYSIKDEIFILKDDNLAPGNAVIEKENGKIDVGIDVGFKILKSELLK